MAVRVEHPLCARLYVRQSRQAERLGLAQRRAQLLAGLNGSVLEVGAGNGLNFAHYPPSVTEVIAVEPEPHLREHAEHAARDAPVAVTAGRVARGAQQSSPKADGVQIARCAATWS
jgi:protein-L-isoaspartate O-methyltransferase